MARMRFGVLSAMVGMILVGCGHRHYETPEPVSQTGPGVPIARRGRPLTLQGASLTVGQPAPDAVLRPLRGRPVRLSDYRGKVLLLSIVPQLGTAVCDQSTRYLEDSDLNKLDGVAVITISTDSQSEQNRWAQDNDARNHTLLSDAKREFGPAYGLLVQETRYLARSVIVIDAEGVIRYIQTQREMARLPDFGAAEDVVRSLVEKP